MARRVVECSGGWGAGHPESIRFERSLPVADARECDWRLPTVLELQTILAQPYPCAMEPCIDTEFFGPTSQFSAPWTTTPSVDAGGA